MSFTYGGDFDLSNPDIEEAKESILEILKKDEEISRQDLTEILSENYSITTISKAIKEMLMSGIILIRKSGHNKHFFRLQAEDGDNSVVCS